MDNILSKISQDLEYSDTDKAELMYKFTEKVFIGNEEMKKSKLEQKLFLFCRISIQNYLILLLIK